MALNFGEGDITTKTKPIARPYGVSLLFGGIDTTGAILYQTDPSGTMIGFHAKGIGSAEKGIESLLNKHYKFDMEEKEAKLLVLGILKQVMEERIEDNMNLV